MAILGIGVDIVDVWRFENLSERFLQRVYTSREIEYASKKSVTMAQSLAARFAAKEAVIKAFDWRLFGQSFKDIEVWNDTSGKPYISLAGKAKKIAEDLGTSQILLSLSHTKTIALAKVVVLRSEIDEVSYRG